MSPLGDLITGTSDVAGHIASFLGSPVRLRVEVFDIARPPPSEAPAAVEKPAGARGLGRGPPPSGRFVAPPPRGRRLYEATQPFYAGVEACDWPPTFDLDAAAVESIGDSEVYVVVSVLGPLGVSTIVEEFYSLRASTTRAELHFPVTNWLTSHHPNPDEMDFPLLLIDTTTRCDPLPVAKRARSETPLPEGESSAEKILSASLVITVKVQPAYDGELTYMTKFTCGTAVLNRADTLWLLEGAISYRRQTLPDRFGPNEWNYRQSRTDPSLRSQRLLPLSIKEFPLIRCKIMHDHESIGSVLIAEATFEMSFGSSAFHARTPVITYKHMRVPYFIRNVRCQVHALWDGRIVTLYDGQYGNGSGYDDDPDTHEFPPGAFPLMVSPCFGVRVRSTECMTRLHVWPCFRGSSTKKEFQLAVKFDIPDVTMEHYDVEHEHELLTYLEHARWTPTSEAWELTPPPAPKKKWAPPPGPPRRSARNMTNNSAG